MTKATTSGSRAGASLSPREGVERDRGRGGRSGQPASLSPREKVERDRGRGGRSGKVSAIVPTFDRAPLLRRALASIASQSRPPDEVIVVDDGSADRTRALVAEEFPAVRYLFQERRGVSAARNRGIEAATGDWLAFLDSDDEWLPDKLERQLAALAATRETGGARYRVCHTDEIWIRGGRRVNPGARHAKRGGWMFRDCLPLCAISPSSAVLHRSVLEAVGGFDERLPACEDYDLWLRIAARYPVLLVNEPLVVKHGGRADQLSRTTWGLDRFRIRALEKIVESGVLSAADRRAALETLLEKLTIFATGAGRRGRGDEARRYEERIARWRAAARRWRPACGS